MTPTTNRILVINGNAHSKGDVGNKDIGAILNGRYEVVLCEMADVAAHFSTGFGVIVIDTPLEQAEDVLRVQSMLMALPKFDIPRVFVIDDFSHKAMVRAYAIGGDALIKRPFEAKSVYETLEALLLKSRRKVWSSRFADVAEGLESGTTALESIFSFASSGVELSQGELFAHGESVIDTLGQSGLGRWIEAVKSHHSQTFRHCLLVTGIATGFAQHLKMRREDIQRITLAALMHDIGKAAIPLDILEKPARLTSEETIVMQTHPGIGRDLLLKQGNFSAEMVDVVAHHHEYLDGSGYPDKLGSGAINDLVRVTTIADIFAALIEHRAYKKSMTNSEAFAVLQSMAGKLDMALVGAFKPISQTTRLAA